MKVSTGMTYEQFKVNLSRIQQKLARSQEEIASGKKIIDPSDDPVTAAKALRIQADQDQGGQLSKNIQRLQILGGTCESSLNSMVDLLNRAKQLAVTQSSDTMDASTRKTASEEIKGIIEQLVTIGNTKIGDTYVFGGKKSNGVVYTLDQSTFSVTFNGTTEVPRVVVEGSEKMDLGMSGSKVFDNNGTDIFQTLKDFKEALESDDVAGIRNSLTGLDNCLNLTEDNIASIGVYNSRTTTLANNNGTRDTNYKEVLSGMVDVDIASVTADYNTMSTAYQAVAYMMSKMQDINIFNYLR
jgi:flagellar hook-associated protein 3 FlgL